MDPRLHADVTARLDRDFAFKRGQNGHLQQGLCPVCGKKSVWTYADTPWVLRCQRENKCGADFHIKELYPELFEKWSERHPVSEATPHAAAEAYLRDGRGFDVERIRGWFTQENYYDGQLKIGSATVRFPLANGFWERLIDQPQRFGDKKARFKPGTSYAHTWWIPPGLDLTAAREVWIVEGIFDAIALLHHDIAAVSAMSCNNDCAESLKALADACADTGRERPKLVWALDGDKAGRSYTRKWVRASRDAGWDVSAAQIEQTGRAKLDWNDAHQRDRLKPDNLKEYRNQGALLIAASAGAKAVLMYQQGAGSVFPLEFDNRLYQFKLDLEKYHKASEAIEDADPDLSKDQVRERALLEAHAVIEISSCFPQARYSQRHEVTEETDYFFLVHFPDGRPPIKCTFGGAQIASATEFKKRLLSTAAFASFTGTTGMLDTMVRKWWQKLPTVEAVDFIGYSPGPKDNPHRCYVFGDVAVQSGRVHSLNSEDYFELGKLYIKSLNKSVGLHINADDSGFSTAWLGHLFDAFGAKGVVALAFWFGSLFAHQIRETLQEKSFPFIEIVGEPGAGKTTLIEFLWKLCGRIDYEGFDPSKSTLAARARNFAQVSNLPVVLIEGDRQEDAKKGGFDWDELKTAYNGRSTRARGMKDSGNATYEPPFRGTVVISQNAPVSASEAVLSRIVHVFFDRAGHNPETRSAAVALERTPVESVSGFILRAAKAEAKVLERFAELVPLMVATLDGKDGIRSARVKKNHGQVMALVECLREVVPISERMVDAAHDELIAMARAREEALASDHPHVAEFWEIYDYIEGDRDDDEMGLLNHSRGEGLIAISLPHFEQVCADRKLKHAPLPDLKRVLKTSRRHKFVEIRPVNSAINARHNMRKAPDATARPSTVKCWVFEVA
jgi:hypothetical protein